MNSEVRNPVQPPQWADRFLEWFCASHLVDEIQGDLREAFYLRAQKTSVTKARFLFIWEVFKSFKLSSMQEDNSNSSSSPITPMNYFKIAYRSALKAKLYSFINIAGLSIGMACTLLILLFVINELSFDKFHEKSDSIYRIVEKYTDDEGVVFEHSASVQWPVAGAISADYPEIKTVRIYKPFRKVPLVSKEDKQDPFYEERLYVTDSTFFDIFSFEIVRGGDNPLEGPNLAVLTESTARRYFGDEDPIGQTLLLETTLPITVTAITKDTPPNSHFKYDILVSSGNLRDIFVATGNRFGWSGWYWNPVQTYLLLPERLSQADVDQQLPEFTKKYFPERVRPDMYLQPLTSIHLGSHLYQELEVNRSESSIYIALSIAIFILLIASINFINLSTARSMQRAKEVAMRKVMGSSRRQLVLQFLTESVLLSILALLIACGLIAVFLPSFQSLVESVIPVATLLTPQLIAIILLATLVLGMISGLYPAISLSSPRPASILKLAGGSGGGRGGSLFRKVLVVFQFAISIVLLISATVVIQQHQYLVNKELGFDKEEIVMIPVSGTSVKRNLRSFKEELLKNSQVIASSAVSDIIGNDVPNRPFGLPGRENALDLPGLFADFDFVKTFGVKLLEGRDFSRDFGTDHEKFLINEQALALLDSTGWENQNIQWRQPRQIIGVVEDFHFADLRQEIRPLVITVDLGWTSYIAVRVAPGPISETITRLEETWRLFEPDRPFVPFFLNERLEGTYQSEKSAGVMVVYFSILAVIIACLGLLGLTTHSTELRIKEIGIRKVLGASTSSILRLLTSNFAVLVVVANVIAWPVAWYLLGEWLQGFTYQVNVSWWLFVAAGVATLLIATATISLQSLKAANTNPVETLRDE